MPAKPQPHAMIKIQLLVMDQFSGSVLNSDRLSCKPLLRIHQVLCLGVHDIGTPRSFIHYHTSILSATTP
jgi:hypothetical protein